MATKKKTPAEIRRTQEMLTKHLGPLLDATVPRPHAGWIRATRDALGMNASQLAHRIGFDPSRVSRIEKAETVGTIRLDTLQRAAEAMDCHLVYAIVPNGGSYESVIESQARQLGDQTLHTMALEAQEPDPDGAKRVRAKIADDLLERGKLWNH